MHSLDNKTGLRIYLQISNGLSDSRTTYDVNNLELLKTKEPQKGKLLKVYGGVFRLPTELVVKL